MSDWKTIDSAPLNHQVILFLPARKSAIHPSNNTRDEVVFGTVNYWLNRQPTHWMPLPLPPQACSNPES